MDKLYEELFRAMNQFRKLKFAEMFPMINRTDFFVMCTIMDKGENGKITISELASRAKMLPSAISRTLKEKSADMWSGISIKMTDGIRMWN